MGQVMGRLAWLTIGWISTAGLVLGFYLRSSPSTNPILIGLIGVIPLVLVAPLASLGLSAWKADSAYLRLAGLGTGVIYLATFVSPGAVVGCSPETSADEIVIYSHNAYWGQSNPSEIVDSVEAADADIVVLQEIWPELSRELTTRPALEAWPYRSADLLTNPAGTTILSRWPLTQPELTQVADRPHIRATVETPSGPLVVHALHLAAPTDDGLARQWVAGLDYLAQIEPQGPTVMVGDFNATADHAQFRNLLDRGWVDAHEMKGCGFGATWPVGRGLPFAVLRLDHVLISGGIEVLSVEHGDASGSDHVPIRTALRIEPGAVASSS
jgi:endonuclease/exonuclease/phosphatase family metal-dependent hydrolase